MIFFPISMDMLGIAFLIAIILMVIYFFVYRADKNIQHRNNQELKEEFLKDDSKINFLDFGFPKDSEIFFNDRYIDTEKGIAVIKTRGHFGVSLCVHSQLMYTRLYFFIDFKHFDRPSPVIFINSLNDKKTMLKINSESSMFSHDDLRYFDAKTSVKDIILNEKISLEVNGKKYRIEEEDLHEIKKTLSYVINLDDQQGEFLKKWRRLNDNIND